MCNIALLIINIAEQLKLVLMLTMIAICLGHSPAFAHPWQPKTLHTNENSYFSHPVEILSKLLAGKGKVKRNNFCVVSHGDVNYQYTWVYWQEGKAIILWEPSKEIVDLATSRRYIHLPQDIVANQADLHGSTYLVTSQWVNSLLKDCQVNGKKFTLSTH